MLIIIDNYDSFTYNLYQYIGEINPDIQVFRNDKISVEEIAEKKPSHIIISPGPGFPKSAGICIELIQKLSGKIPILGICLGHQAIIEAFGGNVIHAENLMHGKQDTVTINPLCPLFQELEQNLQVGRYHSLIGEKETLPDYLNVTAVTKKGEIMAVEHAKHKTYGVQFHPESILTPDGKKIIRNFLGGVCK